MKIGIITYHSAYNFGSVLQAFATQKAIDNLGFENEIIDYRPIEGDYFYRHLLFRHQGLKFFIADLTTIPVIHQRKIRAYRFEKFISNYLRLSDCTFKQPSDLSVLNHSYDLVISGSDQIINKHSNELINVGWEYMNPYLLTWCGSPKISYASSPASMTDSEMELISDDLKKFTFLSAREEDASRRISNVTGKSVDTVCDPTLLLDSSNWKSEIAFQRLNLPDEYVLFYSLKRPRVVLRTIVPQLKRLSERLKLPVVVITPLAGYIPKSSGLINCLSAGPVEFLSLIKYAKLVVTDSYHGTLFSINFGTPFWTIEPKADDTRKIQILNTLNLRNRIIPSINEIEDVNTSIDFDQAQKIIGQIRRHSLHYLNSSIENSILKAI